MTSTRTFRLVIAAVLVMGMAVAAVVAVTSRGDATMACQEQKKAKATLKDASGENVGVVTFWNDGTCETRVVVDIGSCCLGGENPVTTGFHGVHIHTTGKCEPDAVDAEGKPSAFFTAGSHWNPDAASHASHKGDLPPLLVTEAGLAHGETLTDRFGPNALLDEDGSAVILHQAGDNLAHIPATTAAGGERYHSHAYDTQGADKDSLATGDGGARFACGVVKKVKG